MTEKTMEEKVTEEEQEIEREIEELEEEIAVHGYDYFLGRVGKLSKARRMTELKSKLEVLKHLARKGKK